MSKAIDDLKNEHKAIQTGLQILGAMIGRFEAGSAMDTSDARSFIGFLKEFADKCHHGKEEGILFPALVKAGIPDKGGPVGAMLAEHVQGRGYIKEMESALTGTPDMARFARAARAYSNLLTAHIQKENDVLFPAAEKVLNPELLQKIYAGFEEHEEKVIGQGRHEELHALLHRLKERYGG